MLMIPRKSQVLPPKHCSQSEVFRIVAKHIEAAALTNRVPNTVKQDALHFCH